MKNLKLTAMAVAMLASPLASAGVEQCDVDNGKVIGADITGLTGTANCETIYAFDSADLVKAKAGSDTVYGGDDNDVVHGNGGKDTLYGQADDDTLYGGAGADVLVGGIGNDTLFGDGGKDTLTGGPGDDALDGGEKSDTYYFSAGDGIDTLVDDGLTGTDQVHFFVGALTEADVSFDIVDTDLVIDYTTDANVSTDQLTIANWSGQIEEFFVNGVKIDSPVVVAPGGAFVSIWRTWYPNEEITLPLREVNNAGDEFYRYDFTVDWGDGSTIAHVDSFDDTDISHVYAVADKNYTVTITGLVEAWYFNDEGSSKNYIREVVDLGDMGWINLERAFFGCPYLTSFAGGDTSSVTNMSWMFAGDWGGLHSLSSLDLSGFDTSNVTDMTHMFAFMESLSSLDLSSFDTSNVTDMSWMFAENGLTSLNLSSFNTSNVTDMSVMFAASIGNLVLDLSGFDTSNVTDMSSMFASSSFTSLDLSSFDTSNVTDMSWMFGGALSMTSLNANSWDIGNVTDSGSIFLNTNPALTVYCDQASGDLFGQACN